LSSVQESVQIFDASIGGVVFIVNFQDSSIISEVISGFPEYPRSIQETSTVLSELPVSVVTFEGTIQENGTVTDSFQAVFLWNVINDAQTANWQLVNDSQSTSWQTVNDSQTANWQVINDLP
jgi:hypothetical protein